MSFINTKVSSAGTECDFLKEMRRSILALDSHITCDQSENDINSMFVSTTSQPDVNFRFGIDGLRLNVRRNLALNSTCNGYNFQMYIQNTAVTTISITFSKSSLNYETATERAFNLIFVKNENAFLFFISNYNYTILAPMSSGFSVVFMLKMQEIEYFGFSNNYSPLKNGLYHNDNLFSTSSINVNRFPYSRQDGKIEIVKNKVITKNNVFQGENDAFFDCSCVSPYTPIEIDSVTYCPINENTLMPC